MAFGDMKPEPEASPPSHNTPEENGRTGGGGGVGGKSGTAYSVSHSDGGTFKSETNIGAGGGGNGVNLAMSVQPHIRQQMQEREEQAALLQKSGSKMFLIVLALSSVLMVPFIVGAAFAQNVYLAISLFCISDFICLAIIAIYGYLVYRYRNETPIQVRGTRFLVYLFSSTVIAQISSFGVTIVVIYFHYKGDFADVGFKVAYGMLLILMSLGDSLHFGCMCGRLKIVEQVFTKTKAYTQEDLFWSFHKPIILICSVGLISGIVPVVYVALGRDFQSVQWLFAGYMIVGGLSLSMLTWRTWRTRRITNLFCDWYQNLRTVAIYSVLWIGFNILVQTVHMDTDVQVAVMQVGHQIALLVFLADSFTATLVHLWRTEHGHPNTDVVETSMELGPSAGEIGGHGIGHGVGAAPMQQPNGHS